MSSHGLFVALVVGLGLSITSFVMANGDRISKKIDAEDNKIEKRIALPLDFRGSMLHLGSWFVPEGEASGFHDVYANREAVEHFRATGAFPDGATIVKELRAATAGNYTTGTGVSYANDQLKQWFVMVKDKENRHAGSGDWGDGWGWALFKPDNGSKNLVKNYKIDCLGCHIPAKDSDWVYTEAYPTLKSDY